MLFSNIIAKSLALSWERKEEEVKQALSTEEEANRIRLLEMCLFGCGVPSAFYRKELTEETMEEWRRRGNVLLQKLHVLVRSEAEMTKWDYEEMEVFEMVFELWLMLEPFEVGEEEERRGPFKGGPTTSTLCTGVVSRFPLLGMSRRRRPAELPASEAKWVTLKKITFTDETGKERLWEAAERKTRSKGGIDAVAIMAILQPKKKDFPPATVIIEQYRPPVNSFVIGTVLCSVRPS
ncbi:hypothetical protein M422DRAFT_261249, partial [Sphaerobolus stellatus SS14]